MMPVEQASNDYCDTKDREREGREVVSWIERDEYAFGWKNPAALRKKYLMKETPGPACANERTQESNDCDAANDSCARPLSYHRRKYH